MNPPISVPATRRLPAPFFPRAAAAFMASPPAQEIATQGIAGLFFVLMNIALFVRPSDLVPEISLPTYEILIIAAFILGFPLIQRVLGRESLRYSPIVVCVLGLQIAVILSQLFTPMYTFPFLWGVRNRGYKFFKVVVYFLLLVGVLNTARRLQRFLIALNLMIFVLIGITLLHFANVIHIPRIQILQQIEKERQIEDNPEGFIYTIRLQSLGIYSDPNDLCMILVVGIALSMYLFNYPGSGPFGVFWLLPMACCGYGIYLTQSRGGFIAMLTMLMVLFHARFGWFRSILLGAVVLPVMFMAFAGRATNISTTEDTAVTRLQLWSEGLGYFRQAPIFGIGMDEFEEQAGIDFVAHNSYIHSYAELGFFGGTLFVGAIYLSLWTLYRYGTRSIQVLDPEQRRLRPYLMALIAGYCTSMITLSRTTIAPTYMVLGLAAAYIRTTPVFPPVPLFRVDARLVRRLVLVSLAVLFVFYIYVRTNVTWGGGH